MQEIQLSLISPSPHPIRKSWDEGKMQELAQSIKEQGVIVPIKVRPIGAGTTIDPDTGEVWEGVKVNYEVVYGHRRIEAAKRAGMEKIPAIVESVDDTDKLIQSLIENVQREDMHPIDIAHAIDDLINEGLDYADIERMGILDARRADYFHKLLDETEVVQSLIAKHKGGGKGATHNNMSHAVPKLVMSEDAQPITETHTRQPREAGIKLPVEREKILVKASNEGMTYRETRAVADAYAKADTPELKEAILEVDAKVAKTPEQIMFTARSMGKGEAYSNFQDKKRAQKKRDVMEGFDRAVKTFLDFTKDYSDTVKMAQEIIFQ